MIQLAIIGCYLALLLGLGFVSSRLFRGTSRDYMLASHSIGPFLLLMSLFGTTMTAFALVGSTGKAFEQGIGVYGVLASSSGIVHSLCFFLLGVKLWSFGKQHGYTTQIQFFRDRLESDRLGLLLFPLLVALVVVYLLIGVMGAGATINEVTQGTFPQGTFPRFLEEGRKGFEVDGSKGGVPSHVASLAICGVVLIYVFFGGMRGTAWANTFQTVVFMVLGVVTFFVIADKLGGLSAATQAVVDQHPEKLTTGRTPPLVYFSFLLIPLSVGTFPHVFQHWLTARSASAFKLPIVAHPIFILIVWLPCILLGVWATSATIDGELIVPATTKEPHVLGLLVSRLTTPVLGGFLSAGILAAIMSSLDSQFLCLGTMFTEDIVVNYAGKNRFSERQVVILARLFIVAIVLVTYVCSLFAPPTVFDLAIWSFSGFTALVPLAIAACYWKRLTKAGAYASVIAAGGSWAWLFYASDFGHTKGYTSLGMLPVGTMFLASTAALIVVSLLTTPPRRETLAKFFREV